MSRCSNQLSYQAMSSTCTQTQFCHLYIYIYIYVCMCIGVNYIQQWSVTKPKYCP